MASGGLKLAPLITELKVDIKNFKSDMEKAGTLGVNEAKKISRQMETTAKVGETLSKTGSLLTKGLTVPIVGIGAATTKMAVDFESSFAKVSTLLDSNVVDFDQYKNELLDASSESKVAVDEFSESVYQSISAGVDQTKAIDFTTEAMKLAKGGFTDGAKAVDVLTTAINGYNLKTEDAARISDLLITTQNLGKTTVDELASSMGAVIPVANSVNFDITELSASYAQLTKNGIATAESGTYLKAMLSELGKAGTDTDKALRELTGKGFADLKKEGVSTSQILNMLSQYAAENDKTLKDMFGSIEAGSAALVLAKGNGQEYEEMLMAIGDSAGATQAAFEKMDATPAEQLKGALNELRNEGIRFGAAFVPVIEKVSDILGEAADAFSGLSEEQQENVIKWGLVLASAGPTLKVIGGGIQTYTNLSSVMGGASKAAKEFGQAQKVAEAAAKGASAVVGHSGLTGSMVGLLGTCAPVAAGVAVIGTGFYAMHEGAQLAGRSVTEASDNMSIMEKVLATLNGTEIHTREELEQLGLVTKDYGDILSTEFVSAMDTARGKVADFNTYLTEVNLDGIVTAEESNAVVQRVEDMCNSAIQTIQEKKDEAQSNLRALFMAEDGVIDESEQQVLDSLGTSYDEQLQVVQQHVDAVNQIKQEAAAQNGQLNTDQITALGQHYEQLAQLELEASAQTKEELLAAQKDFQDQIVRMNAEQASELLMQKAEERDSEMEIISQKYDDGISQLEAYMETADETQKAGYQEQIDALEKAKREALEKEQDKYEQYYEMALESNKNLEDAINKYTGEVLTNQDKMCQDNLDTMRNMYKDLGSITESGCYEMWDAQNQHYSRVAVKVDETTGEIIGAYDLTNGMVAGYCESMGQDAEEMANQQDASFKTVISAAGAYVDYATGNIVLANGQAIASLDDLKLHTDGTRQGIIDINGTPCEITVKDGAVTKLQEISSAADKAAEDRTLTINVVAAGVTGALSSVGLTEYQNVSSYHYNGLDNVPYDGYQAVLHKGERVLTAEENKAYSSDQGIDYVKMEQCMRSAVRELTMNIAGREFGRVIDNRLRERGLL